MNPQGGNILGRRRKTFHPLHPLLKPSLRLPVDPMRIADLYAPRINKGNDLMTTTRSRNKCCTSTSSKLLNAARVVNCDVLNHLSLRTPNLRHGTTSGSSSSLNAANLFAEKLSTRVGCVLSFMSKWLHNHERRFGRGQALTPLPSPKPHNVTQSANC